MLQTLAYTTQLIYIQGSGSQLRSWLHVYDACEAISRVSLHGRTGELYNIGSQYEHNIKQLAVMIDWIIAQIVSV
jgi:dTDP-D-glucose 4,6-dehydratase